MSVCLSVCPGVCVPVCLCVCVCVCMCVCVRGMSACMCDDFKHQCDSRKEMKMKRVWKEKDLLICCKLSHSSTPGGDPWPKMAKSLRFPISQKS